MLNKKISTLANICENVKHFFFKLRAIEEQGVELRRQQRVAMKQKVEEWNQKRRENGEEVLVSILFKQIFMKTKKFE
jgi:hypothetical protein